MKFQIDRVMKLVIGNIHKVIDTHYHNGRFVCTKALETETNYRFQFHDTQAPSARYVWIEITKYGHWNNIEGNWEYQLNYLRCPSHCITAKWFEFPPNVQYTFEEALKTSL